MWEVIRSVIKFVVLFLPGILLSRTRFSVEKLVSCIKANPDFDGKVLPEAFLGQTAMTDVQQKRVLDNFRLGLFNCLLFRC